MLLSLKEIDLQERSEFTSALFQHEQIIRIGAGKSTVMHALAGKVKESSKLRLEGLRYINGQAITGSSQIPAAFVKQEVTFFPHMTVRETLAFRVELKLGSLLSKAAQAERVEELIQELNLEKAADTIVGDAKVRGVSGGERRRLAIACELISSPSVIFLDEPTSGLDSTAATSLVSALKSLADSGKTIVAVIHQPSQHVFSAFDDLLLVSEGKQMYFGETSKAREYMNKHVGTAPAEMGYVQRSFYYLRIVKSSISSLFFLPIELLSTY